MPFTYKWMWDWSPTMISLPLLAQWTMMARRLPWVPEVQNNAASFPKSSAAYLSFHHFYQYSARWRGGWRGGGVVGEEAGCHSRCHRHTRTRRQPMTPSYTRTIAGPGPSGRPQTRHPHTPLRPWQPASRAWAESQCHCASPQPLTWSTVSNRRRARFGSWWVHAVARCAQASCT